MVYMDEWEYRIWLELHRNELTALPEDDQTVSQEVEREDDRMPRNTSSPSECIEKYVRSAQKASKDSTYHQYRTVLHKMTKEISEAGFDPSPYRISQDAVRYLLDELWKDNEVSYRKWRIHILSRYCIFFGNTAIRDMGLRWPKDDRPNADWLTDDEQADLLEAPKTALQKVVIDLELNHGLRIAEVCNIRLEDVHLDKGIAYFYGKGPGIGKPRFFTFKSSTEDIIREWLKVRAEYVAAVRAYDPHWQDPGTLLLYKRYDNKPAVDRYSCTGHSIDRSVIHPLRESLGMHFTNHTLRRTYGRTLYHAGVELATISHILGHDDIATTIKYLGINKDDQDAALDVHSDYQKRIIRKRIAEKGGVQTD